MPTGTVYSGAHVSRWPQKERSAVWMLCLLRATQNGMPCTWALQAQRKTVPLAHAKHKMLHIAVCNANKGLWIIALLVFGSASVLLLHFKCIRPRSNLRYCTATSAASLSWSGEVPDTSATAFSALVSSRMQHATPSSSARLSALPAVERASASSFLHRYKPSIYCMQGAAHAEGLAMQRNAALYTWSAKLCTGTICANVHHTVVAVQHGRRCTTYSTINVSQ